MSEHITRRMHGCHQILFNLWVSMIEGASNTRANAWVSIIRNMGVYDWGFDKPPSPVSALFFDFYSFLSTDSVLQRLYLQTRLQHIDQPDK